MPGATHLKHIGILGSTFSNPIQTTCQGYEPAAWQDGDSTICPASPPNKTALAKAEGPEDHPDRAKGLGLELQSYKKWEARPTPSQS